MKLAIFGSSAIALEAVLRFHYHGASVTWFNGDEGNDEESGTSEAGHRLLVLSGFSDKGNWKTHYYEPLIKILKEHQEIKPHKVLSVTKRYLARDEEISGRSRFYDLFRVIYQVDPSEFIQEQKKSNPETYQRLSDEFVHSLQSHLEMYEDFDLVLDLRKEIQATSLSITGRALGERRITPDKISYGKGALKKAQEMKPHPDLRELALIGSGPLAARILISLRDWLKETRSRLFIVSSEALPFEKFREEGREDLVRDLDAIYQSIHQEFEGEITEFHKKLREWQELDDFVQAKIPRPAEPISRLVHFSGHNATAVDQLIDKKRIFLTLEKPDFREGLTDKDNNFPELKTIGVDEALVANPLVKEDLDIFLRRVEKGFFSFAPMDLALKGAWEEDLKKLKGCEDEIFKLFSPVDSH